MDLNLAELNRLRRQRRAAAFVVPNAPTDFDSLPRGLARWNHLVNELAGMVQSADGPLPMLGNRVIETLNECPELAGQVFVGLHPDSGVPMLVPREVLYDHAYIVGATGSGKTSCGMIPLLEQLSLHQDGKGNSLGDLPPHPVIVIDLKESPDPGLKAAADRVAQARRLGEQCLLFSAKKRVESLRWDLLSEARKLDGIPEQSGFILNGFGLVYDPVYGEEYFANSMRTALNKVLESNGLESLTYNRLVELVGELISKKAARKPNLFKGTSEVATSWRDARGLYDKIQSLRHVDKIYSDSLEIAAGTLDLSEIIDEGQVLYVHLPSTFMPNDSWDIGRMLVFSLMAKSVDTIYTGTSPLGKKRRCFIFIDEFQRMGVKNIVQRFEDARALGLTFILSHQTPKSLPTKDGKLDELIFQNTAFRQAFTIEDLDLLQTFERLSGLKSHYLSNENRTINNQRGQTDTKSHAVSHGTMESENSKGVTTWGTKHQVTDTTAHAVARSAGDGANFGMSEQLVSRFDSEANRLSNSRFLSSIIYVRDGGRGSLTPTNAKPQTLLSLFTAEEELRTIAELGFVSKPKEVRPPSKVKTEKQKSPSSSSASAAEVEQMKKLIGEARRALVDEMPEDRTVEYFARSRKLSVEQVKAICVELGIAQPSGPETVLSVVEMKKLGEGFDHR